MAALNFEEPDRVPRFFSFWPEFVEAWQKSRGKASYTEIAKRYGSDVMIVGANEAVWPSQARVIERNGDRVLRRTGWGVLEWAREKAFFSQTVETAVPTRVDPDTLKFDDPLLETRYEGAAKSAEQYRKNFAVFAKTGGPYLRAEFMRGAINFLTDIAEDPDWVKAFVERVTDHIMTVGVESIRRFKLQETGIGIYDDVCTISSPFMGAKTYEKVFYPSLCKMVKAYKAAGASKVYHHCDGNVSDLLELWVAAGIDAVHPLEARVCPHPLEVMKRFNGRLAVMGGLDNCRILPRGGRAEIRAHLESLLEAGRGGGYVLAPHSIGPDISVETMEFVREFLDEQGLYHSN